MNRVRLCDKGKKKKKKEARQRKRKITWSTWDLLASLQRREKVLTFGCGGWKLLQWWYRLPEITVDSVASPSSHNGDCPRRQRLHGKAQTERLHRYNQTSGRTWHTPSLTQKCLTERNGKVMNLRASSCFITFYKEKKRNCWCQRTLLLYMTHHLHSIITMTTMRE